MSNLFDVQYLDKTFENWTGDSASSLIQYFNYTVECRAKLHYFCTYGKELED